MVVLGIEHKKDIVITETLINIKDKASETYFKSLFFNINYYTISEEFFILNINIPIINFLKLVLTVGTLTSLALILVLSNFNLTPWLIIPSLSSLLGFFCYMLDNDYFWYLLLKKGLKKKGYTDKLIKLEYEKIILRLLNNGTK